MLSQASQAHGLPQASYRPDQRLTGTTSRGEVVPVLVELEVAVPRLMPASR